MINTDATINRATTKQPVFANLNTNRKSVMATSPQAVTFGDSFMFTAPQFGFSQPTVIGNGDHASIQLAAASSGQAFAVKDKSGNDIGQIEYSDPKSDVTVNPYASKDGQYLWATAKKDGQEFRLLIGAGGNIDIKGAKAGMSPDGLTDIQPLLPEADALKAAALNERANTKQNYVKTAFIPASSLGTRFQPILESLGGEAKPNAYLYGQTSILRRLVEHYKHYGIEKFIIGVPTSRQESFKKNLADTGADIQFVPEDKPTGTAGILGRILNGEYPDIKFNPDEPLLVGYGDAVLKGGFDVGALINEHAENNADVSLVGAQVPDDKMHKFGMIISEKPNESSAIKGFAEKPKTKEAKEALGEHRLASTAIHVFSPKTIAKLKEKYEQLQAGKIEKYDHGFDFAGHLLEQEVGKGELKMFVHKIDFDKWVDVGHLNTMNETHRRIANGDIFGADETKQARAQVGDGGAIFYGGKATKEAFNKAFPDAKVEGNVVVVQAK